MGNSESPKKKDDSQQMKIQQENETEKDPEMFQALNDLDSAFLNLIEQNNQIGIKLNFILESMHEQANQFKKKPE
ncbi:unnamed protein product [Paramecium sonneborni]|uniref:Uncharacterized protein n=1 Tax=Paramecium sonneborni TaxID=65129 RepID=A0A8S1P4H2_9CILI|nr:unnamed protein product [Paramecium sonneborni]